MARKTRVEFAGAAYHVIARGNNRERIFLAARDYEMFFKVLEEAHGRYNIRILAYCLMPNHYHLAIETPEANLSRAMAWIQTTFTVRYRNKHKRAGHVFQGRYKAELVETGSYLKTLIAYIHLNPIRSRKSGKLVMKGTYEHLREFKWSSHRAYEGRAKPDWLDLSCLKFWGRPRAAAMKEYARVMKGYISGKPLDWHEKVRFGILAGSDDLLELIQRQLSEKKAAGKESGLREKRELQNANRKDHLSVLLNGVDDRRVQIWARVRLAGERPVDLAREFKYRDGGSILQIVKRTEARSEKDDVTKKQLQTLRRKNVKCRLLTPRPDP